MSKTKQTQQDIKRKEQKTQLPKRPNEQGSFSVEGHLRIFDPKTRQVYMEGRA